MTRYAIVTAPSPIVQQYLPSNYYTTISHGRHTLIAGDDDAGWTLDGYVIPRLASGLYRADELTADEYATQREVMLDEQQVEDEMEWAAVRGISAPDF